MSTSDRQKLKWLLDATPKGAVVLSARLAEKGISPQLQRRYRLSGWLTALGTGAMVRTGDKVSWEGALYALQDHTLLNVHPGGKTALSMHGKAHFLEMARSHVCLFGPHDARLPKWFSECEWGVKVDYHRTSFLPPDLGLVDFEVGDFSIKASSPARALMECLHLASTAEDLIEARELMDGLNNLRPAQTQTLLEACESVKVKRLFLYLADLSGHDWLKHVRRTQIDLGSGIRSLVSEGTYVPEYQITVPKEFAEIASKGV